MSKLINKDLPTDSIEESKKTSYIEINNNIYRLVYTKAFGNNLKKNILRIEINADLKSVLKTIEEILKKEHYEKIHIYIKYKYFLKLTDNINEIFEKLKSNKYSVIFAYISKNYHDEDYALVYDLKYVNTR